MKINGEIKSDEMTLEKLQSGDCFVFTDNDVENVNNLYLKTDLDYVVLLSNGDAFDYYDSGWTNRPVRIINVELNIL